MRRPRADEWEKMTDGGLDPFALSWNLMMWRPCVSQVVWV